jgi:hypothetical protein
MTWQCRKAYWDYSFHMHVKLFYGNAEKYIGFASKIHDASMVYFLFKDPAYRNLFV